jgi:hypothetical protein
MNSDQFGNNIAPFNYDLFFERIRYCELNKLETYRTVEHITDNFDVEKLNLLYQDFESFVTVQKNEFLEKFTEADYSKAFSSYALIGLELPPIEDFNRKHEGYLKHRIIPGSDKPLDSEKLLFPQEFQCCYQFLSLLKQLIKKHERNMRLLPATGNSPCSPLGASIDPFRFIRLKESEFISNFTIQNNIPSARAHELYRELNIQLEIVTKNRADKISTKVLLKERFKNLSATESQLIKNWLLRSLLNNDSYVYAYNFLVKEINCQAKWAMHALKDVSDAELFVLLDGPDTSGNVSEKSPSPYSESINIETPTGKRKKPVKSFPEFFDTNNPSAFAEALKKKFAKDTPTTLTVLVYTLRHEFEKPLLIINSGEFSMFHKAMQEYFSGIDIGRRQLYNRDKSVFPVQYREVARNCKSRVLSILKSIDN